MAACRPEDTMNLADNEHTITQLRSTFRSELQLQRWSNPDFQSSLELAQVNRRLHTLNTCQDFRAGKHTAVSCLATFQLCASVANMTTGIPHCYDLLKKYASEGREPRSSAEQGVLHYWLVSVKAHRCGAASHMAAACRGRYHDQTEQHFNYADQHVI